MYTRVLVLNLRCDSDVLPKRTMIVLYTSVIISFNPLESGEMKVQILGRYGRWYVLYLRDEKTKAQRGKATCPRSHRQ